MKILKLLLLFVFTCTLGGCIVVDDTNPRPARFASRPYPHEYPYHHHEHRRPRPMFDGRPADFPGVKAPNRPQNVSSGRGMPPTVR